MRRTLEPDFLVCPVTRNSWSTGQNIDLWRYLRPRNDCYYHDLCFGVFALSVEIRPSAAGGTRVSCAITISFAEIFSP